MSSSARAARWVRRMVGAKALDELLATSGRDETVYALLQLDPVVDARSVQDGREFLADKRADHPDGVPVERWARRVRGLRNAVGVLFGLTLLVLVLQLGGPGALQHVAGAALPVLGFVGIGLIWLASSWRAVVVAGEARYAVRWAAGRPGQATRGLPAAEPFGGFRSTVLVAACLVIALAVLLTWFWVKTLLDGTEYLLQASLFVGTVWLVGALLVWLHRALGRAQRVANEHLFLLRDDEEGLRVDTSTIVAEQYLVLHPGPWQATSLLGGVLVEERTVYPLTTLLTPEEVRRRHDELAQNLDLRVTWVGGPTQTPIVTVHTPDAESAEPSRWQGEYAGGWCIASGTVPGSGRTGWLIVREDPQRFTTQVLPLLRERSGFEPGTLTPMEPERVGEGRWFREWVAARDPRSRGRHG